jgi:hypothetical protein
MLLKLAQAGEDRVRARVRPPRSANRLTRHGRGHIGQALVLLKQQPVLAQTHQ